MRTLPDTATDAELRDFVAEWWDLLARDDLAEAIAMLQPVSGDDPWTPETLRDTIRGYGVVNTDPETLAILHDEWGISEFAAAPIADHPDRQDILADIDVNREDLYGLSPDDYVGMVHFSDVPLNGGRSDMTARFHIAKARNRQLCLELLDIHVM